MVETLIILLIILATLHHIVFLYLILTNTRFSNFLIDTHTVTATHHEDDQELCICGDPIDECPEAYVHMTSGV